MNGDIDQRKHENAWRGVDHIPYFSTCTNHSKTYMFIRKTFEGGISFYQMTHCSHLVKLMSGGKGQVKKKRSSKERLLGKQFIDKQWSSSLKQNMVSPQPHA
jgi:hypothetical protein